MATSLADLLDLTTAHARGLTPTAEVCADVARALHCYGTAFDRCAITEPAHPARGHSEHLAAACARYAASTHQHRGRLGELAAATADTVGLLSPELTVAARWAVTVAVADTALDLAALTADAAPLRHIAAVSAHRQLTRRLTDALHLAAQHPPNANATALLDRPLPASPHVPRRRRRTDSPTRPPGSCTTPVPASRWRSASCLLSPSA
jgi:hypothetical protein